MSRKTTWLLIPIVTTVIAIGLFASFLANRSVSSDSKRSSSSDALTLIAGYKDWAKVNPQPVLMETRTAILCTAPTLTRGQDVNGQTNPHHRKYITVYVNEAGRKAMTEQSKPQFPEGSVIVKEKLSSPSSKTPELLTVMIKRENGFNPENGDWEFMVVDGGATKIEQGKLESCQTCHQAMPKTDFIFRSYLPNDIANKLK